MRTEKQNCNHQKQKCWCFAKTTKGQCKHIWTILADGLKKQNSNCCHYGKGGAGGGGRGGKCHGRPAAAALATTAPAAGARGAVAATNTILSTRLCKTTAMSWSGTPESRTSAGSEPTTSRAESNPTPPPMSSQGRVRTNTSLTFVLLLPLSKGTGC